jgi:hypothetical protein
VLSALAQLNRLAGVTLGKAEHPNGESGNGSGQEYGSNCTLARSWGAACGEPALLWKALCHPPGEGSESKAQGQKQRSERREPEVRELEDLAGANDNKLVAEIGERRLAARSMRSLKSSSDGGERSEWKVASWPGWPVKYDELGFRGP